MILSKFETENDAAIQIDIIDEGFLSSLHKTRDKAPILALVKRKTFTGEALQNIPKYLSEAKSDSDSDTD